MIAALAFLVAAAQPAEIAPPEGGSDNPIPPYGGAIKFADEKEADDRPPHALDAGWKGEKVCELLEETAELRALKCVFAPGQGHEPHRHPPHFGYIVEGGVMRITDENGTRDRDLSAGGSWTSDGVDRHSVLNIGDTTATFVIVEPKLRAVGSSRPASDDEDTD
ncbi:MAG: cupin domain-containing protein [Pseudomonadota bacterium]